MLRRTMLNFLLQGAGLASTMSLAPAAKLLAASVDPATRLLQDTYRRFKTARATHPELAGWAGLSPGGSARQAAKLSGRWPDAVRGELFRNGPGLFERNGMRYQHWFDGDGLIQRWRIEGSASKPRVSHQAQFIQTEKFVQEQASQRFEVMAAGTTIPDARAISGPDGANTANTAVLHLNGKSFALWEAGSATEFDRETLATIGPKIWLDELEGVAFSAHPVFEKDGSVWNVGHLGDQLVIYRISKLGALLEYKLHQLPRGGYMHSFVQTESKLVFVLAPLVRVREATSYFEGLGWKPELGSLMVVVDKAALSNVRFAELESGAAYHYGDAWEESDGSIHLRACWFGNDPNFISPMQHYVQGKPEQRKNINARLTQISLAPGAKTAKVSKLAQDSVEFPVTLSLGGGRSEALYLQGNARHPLGVLSKLIRVNRDGKTTAEFDFGNDYLIEEQLPIFIGGKAYALGTVFDAKHAKTGLVLFDLKRIAQGPIAQAWLETAMPLGFHGSFLAA